MDNIVYYLIGFVVLILLGFWIFKKGKQQADNINDYFVDALKIFAFTNDQIFELAALTAAKTADKVQRDSMVAYAVGLASLTEESHDYASSRILGLVATIDEKDWSVVDAATSKNQLAKVDKGMLSALEKSDGQYFRVTYPEFFKDQ